MGCLLDAYEIGCAAKYTFSTVMCSHIFPPPPPHGEYNRGSTTYREEPGQPCPQYGLWPNRDYTPSW
jgi:hypothetical protein